LTLFTFSVTAQPTFNSQAEMEQALISAKKDMLAKRGDLSLPVTEALMKQLKKEGRYNSHFGFDVRLIHGLGLINSSSGAPSFAFLWKLKDESRAYKEWGIFSDACREMARIQEFTGQSKEAYNNLKDAQTVILQYNIDSVYSSFAVRYSSWHRIYGDIDSAKFYAAEAIRVAPQFNQVFEEAEGNLLSGIITAKTDVEKSIAYLKRAAYLYHQIGELATFTSVQSSISRLSLRQNQPKIALLHADSALHYGIKYLGADAYRTNRAYKAKGAIFEEIGQMDSALFYLKKGYETEIESINNTRKDLLLEVDEKYNVEKKEAELKAEKNKNQFLFLLIALAVFFSGILIFYYYKLQKANRITEKQAKELRTLDQLKSRFFANVSHELRTPLTLILAPIREVLGQKKFTKNTLTNLIVIEKNAKQLERMVNEILDLSKLDSDKMIVNTEPLNWHLFLKQTFANFESLAALRKVGFELKYEGSETLIAAVDRLKLETIFNNLLSNAFKFTPNDGLITIRGGTADEYLWAEVEDTGRGISTEDLPYIFNRFYQTKNQNQAAEGGTGIGLALVHELITLLNGKVEVKSEQGKATTFRLELPLEEKNEAVLLKNTVNHSENIIGEEAHFLNEIEEKKAEQLSDNTILLVEDNIDLSIFIQGVLEEYYTVITAYNGQEALEQLAKSPNIELVISDVMMPIMDGFELLKQLKTSKGYKNLPVIMLTARASLNDKLKALRIGVDDYLTKPFIKEELLARIENLLRNAQGRKDVLTYELEEIEVITPIISTEIVSKTVTDTVEKLEELTTLENTEEDLATQKWLDDLEQVVLKNIELSEFSIDGVATEMFMSKRQLYRKIKEHIGTTPLKYVKTYKLNYARDLLENRKVNSVKAAAYSIGYPSTIYFGREFKKEFGRVPSDYLL
jgi:signal transduction histidine kinase/DNA-binding response OmpR family regulator